MGAPIVTGHVVGGRYRLVSALGNGGMGTVWLAEDDLLSRQVAVKEISPPADMTEHERELLRERTLREARTAARLGHPNVVTIFDVVEDDGRPWIVMELVPSRSLRDVVDAEGPLSPQQAAGVGLQILAALRAAHALGIMHRDVKPGNVLIAADGRAVLADFGIARTQDSTALTTSGVLVGSPSYIAPERARGERGGPESDLWSLGATLYALVEGRPAYDRAGPLPTLMAVVNEDPDPPSRAGVLWPVIRGLLDHVPSRRLDPDETERMLRQVAEAAARPNTAPFPAVPPADDGAAAVGRTRAGSNLESAEHTRTLRPWDGVLPAEPEPEPESGVLAPEPGVLADEPDAGALPDPPGPQARPEEPDPRALPDEPVLEALPPRRRTPTPCRTSRTPALPDEPVPEALPEEPDLEALPEAPDLHALPDEPDPDALPERRTPTPCRTSRTPTPCRTSRTPTPCRTSRTPTPSRTSRIPTPSRTSRTPTPCRTSRTPTPSRTSRTPTTCRTSRALTPCRTSPVCPTSARWPANPCWPGPGKRRRRPPSGPRSGRPSRSRNGYPRQMPPRPASSQAYPAGPAPPVRPGRRLYRRAGDSAPGCSPRPRPSSWWPAWSSA